jgi:glutamate/tyrosine decarboxylase-like PLP-dependent enzyme
MNTKELERIIREDLASGYQPFLVCGNAGDVSTGAVDDLSAIAAICKQHNLWFHVDGAYGIPAATLPEYEPLFKGMHEADSIALDPHKWLYAPLEAGCILVKDPQHLLDTYSAHPAYYNFEGSDGVTTVNYYEYGFQNSRGFKALKVWLGLQQAGRSGYAQMIRDDIRLSKHMYDFAAAHPELEAVSQQLSIATFRYVPPNTVMSPDHGEAYLNALNERLLNELQQGGELFLSDAIVQGKYCLRACVVNYRTSMRDIEEVMEIVVREGRKVSELFMPGL